MCSAAPTDHVYLPPELRGPTLRSVFLSYRRNDTEGEAGRLFDELTQRFDPRSIFMDVAAIEPGRDFRKAIDQNVATCSVLLALIGREWLYCKDAAGNLRLEDANDFVRIELASALRRDIPVIPVLVRGAKMPAADQLPDDLQELAFRNAVELTHARWRSDVQVLLAALQPYMDAPRADSAAQVAPQAAAPKPEAAVPVLDGEVIGRISKELAAYIGPIAEVVVKRAARRCASAEELCQVVVLEIEDEQARTRFLQACRG